MKIWKNALPILSIDKSSICAYARVYVCVCVQLARDKSSKRVKDSKERMEIRIKELGRKIILPLCATIIVTESWLSSEKAKVLTEF